VFVVGGGGGGGGGEGRKEYGENGKYGKDARAPKKNRRDSYLYLCLLSTL
jgi:hypothetical protein